MGAAGCEVFAHRGANATHPENTLPAFAEAARLGADGVELDVRLSADGIPVVIHDATVDRTTDGRGPVAGLTAAALGALDAGSWRGEAFAGVGVPTLADVLDALAGTRLRLNVELKPSDRREGVVLARRVVDAVASCGLRDRVIVSSFEHPLLAETWRLDPGLETAVLFRRPLRRPVDHARALGARSLHPFWAIAHSRLLAAASAARLPVRPWTVNDPRQMTRLAGLGAAAIVTDRPDVALAVLRPPATSPSSPAPPGQRRPGR